MLWIITLTVIENKKIIMSPLFRSLRSATAPGPRSVFFALCFSPCLRWPDRHRHLPSLTKRHHGNGGGLHDSSTPQCGVFRLQPLECFPPHPVQTHSYPNHSHTPTSAAPCGETSRQAPASGQTFRSANWQTSWKADRNADAFGQTVRETGTELQ